MSNYLKNCLSVKNNAELTVTEGNLAYDLHSITLYSKTTAYYCVSNVKGVHIYSLQSLHH